jgi:hypothetical protein
MKALSHPCTNPAIHLQPLVFAALGRPGRSCALHTAQYATPAPDTNSPRTALNMRETDLRSVTGLLLARTAGWTKLYCWLDQAVLLARPSCTVLHKRSLPATLRGLLGGHLSPAVACLLAVPAALWLGRCACACQLHGTSNARTAAGLHRLTHDPPAPRCCAPARHQQDMLMHADSG